jgi:hypothetical protein
LSRPFGRHKEHKGNSEVKNKKKLCENISVSSVPSWLKKQKTALHLPQNVLRLTTAPVIIDHKTCPDPSGGTKNTKETQRKLRGKKQKKLWENISVSSVPSWLKKQKTALDLPQNLLQLTTEPVIIDHKVTKETQR